MQFVDPFNGASSDSLGANWAEAEDGVVAFRIEGGGIMRIRGAQIIVGGATIQGRAFVVPGPWGNSQYAELIFDSIGGEGGPTNCGVCVRGGGPSQLNFTGYGLLHRPSAASLELRRFVADQVRLGAVLLNTGGFSLIAGDRLGLRIDAGTNRLRAYRNRRPIPGMNIIDATVATGLPGMLDGAASVVSGGNGNQVAWREFFATDFPAAVLDPVGAKRGRLRWDPRWLYDPLKRK